MKHRIGFNRLGRNVSHRQALYRSMATALFKYERIRTTKPKAKEIRRVAEKMITRARTDSVHNRRIIGKRIKDGAVLAKLFTDIGPRFKNRPGGYTRTLKLGQRYGDASEMVLLELVERTEAPPRRRKKEAAKAGGESGQPKTETGDGAAEEEAKASKPAKGAKAASPAKASKAASKAPSKAKTASKTDSNAKKAAGAGTAKPSKPARAKPVTDVQQPEASKSEGKHSEDTRPQDKPAEPSPAQAPEAPESTPREEA